MNNQSFEPFGESLPASSHGLGAPGKTSDRVYRATIVGFWLVVAIVVVARIAVGTHGNIFSFGL